MSHRPPIGNIDRRHNRMTNYWTETVKRLTPYVPGEQRSGGHITKLNTNENPFPPAPAVLQAIRAVSGDQLRRYPDPESVELRTTLAEYHGLDLDQVFVGNGSDEILALAFLAYFTEWQAIAVSGYQLQFLSGVLQSLWYRAADDTA